MDDITVKKLEDAFLDGCSDMGACLRAGISKPTLYKYQEDTKGFIDRKEMLKTNPTNKSRKLLSKLAATDKEVAIWHVNKADGKPMQSVKLDKDSEITVNIKHYKD
jgi:hypothetical protein